MKNIKGRTVAILAIGVAVLAMIGGGVSYAVASSGSGACTNASPYPDVSQSSQFCQDIQWAKDQGITTGYKDGTFQPGANVSRQAMAAFLHRLAENIPAGATGPQGPTGAQGPAGTPILFESTQNCYPGLCLDAAPGPEGAAGSSGWGWDNTANAPVTNLAVGSTHDFVVGILQSAPHANGTITVSYDPYDFTLNTTPADGDSCVTLGTSVTCDFTDLAHGAVSKPFNFTAEHANPDAVVSVTVTIDGAVATQQVPVGIS